ncbi:MAG: transketolase-like TK C-terminal-containing protein, partial [Candidatus Nanopelagicales bacterium]
LLGINPDLQFQMPDEVLQHARAVRDRGRGLEARWQAAFTAWQAEHPDRAKDLEALFSSPVPENDVPEFALGSMLATRQASGQVLNAIAGRFPRMFGGSADLSESNQILLEGQGAFSREYRLGRNLHFGIREHAMGAILNGLALYGFHAYGGTFLVFAPYMLGAIRLSAIMKTSVTYVLTHDSIGLGEDGPTHQPIETLWSLRALPDFAVVRPADANETVAAWRLLLARSEPAALVLSRQALTTVTPTNGVHDVARGAYVLRDEEAAEALIMATGSEVGIALLAAELLHERGVPTKVISAPCLEWFDGQDAEYREHVLPASITNRVSLEAGATVGWHKYVKTAIGIDSFGASGAAELLYQRFHLTPEDVVAAVLANRSGEACGGRSETTWR